MSGYGPPAPGHPLRGLRWGLLIGVVAAVALFAVVLVVESGRPADGTPQGGGSPYGSAGPAAPQAGGPGSGGPSSSAPSSAAESAVPSGAAPSGGSGPGGGAGGAGPTRPDPVTGAILTRGTLAPGWETEGWSWDSTVAAGTPGPDGRPAYSVTYAKPYGGFAVRQRTTTRPPPGATLQVRVYVAGPAVRLGLQVQSADDGGLGSVVQRDVPSRRWVTLAATVPQLRPPAGVRRVSVIGQDVPAGTRVWVSEMALR